MQKKQQSNNSTSPQSRMTKEQINSYLLYLIGNQQVFSCKPISKQNYERLRNFVNPLKTYDQIYNFHDRMKQKYKSLANIINGLKSNINLNQQEIQEIASKMKSSRQCFYEKTFNIQKEQMIPKSQEFIKLDKNHIRPTIIELKIGKNIQSQIFKKQTKKITKNKSHKIVLNSRVSINLKIKIKKSS